MQRDYDAERDEVTRWAKQYQQQVPGMTWGEAIRIAEKHMAERGLLPICAAPKRKQNFL